MSELLDNFDDQTLYITTIVDEVKTYFSSRRNDPQSYQDFIKKIEKIIQIVEYEDSTSVQLIEAMKELDNLITTINKPENSSVEILEKALDELKKLCV